MIYVSVDVEKWERKWKEPDKQHNPNTDKYLRPMWFPKLYDIQNSLLEHKFPTPNRYEYIISAAGDIYRMMTEKYPDYNYINEKWEILTKYCSSWSNWFFGESDTQAIRRSMADPMYITKRNEYIKNLHLLKEETLKTPIEQKRQSLMVKSLDMIEALIIWFESTNWRKPPIRELEALTDAFATFFPDKFYEALG